MADTKITRPFRADQVGSLLRPPALLAARARPETPARRGPQNAWVLLARVAPEFEEWATFFAAGARKRAAAEAGSRRAVTAREADDLLRDAERFLALIQQALGLSPHPSRHPALPLEVPVAWGRAG